MKVTCAVAPTGATLKPMRSKAPSLEPRKGFPVYDGLDEVLLNATTHPDKKVWHALATCAGYAYSDAETVAMIMARMGLVDNECLKISEVVDAMFICSTSFLVQSADGRVVILCFRGTEPTNVINWLIDADINPDMIRVHFKNHTDNETFAMHAGFYRNVRATRYRVATALLRALDGKSVREGDDTVKKPMEALYITGHSLGGAMAAIMAIMLTTEESYEPIAKKLKAVYTFGGPMVGEKKLAEACHEVPFLRDNVLRFVYNHDVVPQLPMRISGDFAHFGREFRYRGKEPYGCWTESKKALRQARLLAVALAPSSFVTKQVLRFRDVSLSASLYDHGPGHYIAAVTPKDKNEFGA